MVPPVCVQEDEAGVAGSRVDQLIDPVQRKAVIQTCIIEVGVIDADTPFPRFLLDNDSVSDPCGVLDFPDGSSFE